MTLLTTAPESTAPSTFSVLLPVFTLLLGYLLKLFSDWVQHRRTLEREREMRLAERNAKLADRRVEFQRQTLLELQDAVIEVARTTASMAHHDLVNFRRNGTWQRDLYPADLDRDAMLAMRRTSVLMVRVRDETTRQLVQRVKDSSVAATGSHDQETSDSELLKLARAFEELQPRIGELLRRIDDEN